MKGSGSRGSMGSSNGSAASELAKLEGCIRSINLPWYGESMRRHQIIDVKIKDYWLYVFTRSSFDIFVFDLNRIAFLETKHPH